MSKSNYQWDSRKVPMKSTRIAFVSRVRLNPYVRLLARGVHAVAPNMEIGHSYFLSLKWLLRQGRRYDLLHIHWIEHLFMVPQPWQRRKGFVSVILALFLARILGIKIVYTVHNLNHHEGRSPILNNWANHFVFRLADAVHVHDPSVAEEIGRLYGRTHHVFVVPHGSYKGAYPDEVNQQQARAALRERKRIPIPDDAFLFLFLGQVRPYKGIDLLIEAFTRVKDPRARLLIAGKAEMVPYAERIKRLVQDDPRIITHMTYVADEELQYFFRAANVCVFPYRHITTSGAALLAFTFEKPIIAPAMGPFVDLAAQGRGLLYPPGDVDGLRQVLERALEGALDDAAPAVRAYAEAHNWSTLARDHVRVYERLLHRPLLPETPPLPPIVCAGRDPWEGPWRNRHYLLSRLARRAPVLYVEPRPYLREAAKHRRLLWPHMSQPLVTSPDLHVLKLPVWAARSGRAILKTVSDALAARLLRGGLHRALQAYPKERYPDLPKPILWLTAPDQVDILRLVDARIVVYHVVDDYTAYEADHLPPQRLRDLQARHELLLRRADLVLATHPALVGQIRPLNEHVHLVPNGVDIAQFQKALAVPGLPPELEAIPQPRVGYVGVINDKIDLGLLRLLVERLPHVHLVLIGPDMLRHRADERALLDHPRIYQLGFRPPAQLPLYMKGLDVALMPYRLNRWTAHIDPLKLYEYFALGLPVVSTPIPAVRRVHNLLYVGEGNAFVEAVAVALEEASPDLRAQRQAFAQANTWDERAALVETLLRRYL